MSRHVRLSAVSRLNLPPDDGCDMETAVNRAMEHLDRVLEPLLRVDAARRRACSCSLCSA